jgi:hypothetical protein
VKDNKEIERLLEYIKLHGHCRTNSRDKKNVAIDSLLNQIPEMYSKNTLSPKLIIALIRGGYDFKKAREASNVSRAKSRKSSLGLERKIRKFLKVVDALEKHYKRFKNYNLPFLNGENPELGRYASDLRNQHKKNKLPFYKKEILDEINFDFYPKRTKFMILVQKLKSYYKKFKNYDVPYDWGEDPKFSRQLHYFKKTGKKGGLVSYQKEILDKMGVDFQPSIENKKFSMFVWRTISELRIFKEENGHCNVPRNYKPNPGFGRRVSNLREKKKNGELNVVQEKELIELGFEFELRKRAESFTESFQATKKMLVKFRKENGHCNVSSGDKKNRKLYYRLSNLKNSKQNKLLDKNMIKELERLGVEFNPIKILPSYYDEMIEELKQFKKENGHCNVPAKYEKNPLLGNRVRRLRLIKKQGKLSDSRVQELNELGFKFELQKAK